MNKILPLLIILTILLFSHASKRNLLIANDNYKKNILTLATATSTENSGLLDYIHPFFEEETGIKIRVISLGTGAAIRTAIEGNADIILTHAKSREEQFIKEGYGVKRYDVMFNDFIIIGPKEDPAKLKKAKNINDALIKIADNNSIFVSRGDDSGTHIREQKLWQNTGIKLYTETSILKKSKHLSFIRPIGDWYYSIGQGMANTILFAYEKQGYTMVDRGTFLVYKNKVDLEILFEGDEKLFNLYGIVAVNPKKHSHTNIIAAKKYIKWITSKRIQKKISEFKINGKTLYKPFHWKNN